MKEIKRERTIEEVVGYEAFDGKTFKDKEECEKYEQSAESVITKEFEKLFVGKRFPECYIWEDYGYGSDEYEMAIIYIKDETDLHIANRYYAFHNNKAELINRSYVGKKVLVCLGCRFDRDCNPCPKTLEELVKEFEKQMDSFFNPIEEMEGGK